MILVAEYAAEHDEWNGEDYLDASDDIGVVLDVFVVNYGVGEVRSCFRSVDQAEATGGDERQLKDLEKESWKDYEAHFQDEKRHLQIWILKCSRNVFWKSHKQTNTYAK